MRYNAEVSGANFHRLCHFGIVSKYRLSVHNIVMSTELFDFYMYFLLFFRLDKKIITETYAKLQYRAGVMFFFWLHKDPSWYLSLPTKSAPMIKTFLAPALLLPFFSNPYVSTWSSLQSLNLPKRLIRRIIFP